MAGLRRDLTLVAGVVVSVGSLVALVVVVGPTDLVDRLAAADLGIAVLALGAALASVAARLSGYALLCASAGAAPTGARFYLLVLFAGIPRWLLPAGYFGSPPITALYLSKGVGASFGPTMAALAVGEFLAVVVSGLVFVVGLGLVLLTGGHAPNAVLTLGGSVAVVFLAGVVLVGLADRDQLARPTIAAWRVLRGLGGLFGDGPRRRWLARAVGARLSTFGDAVRSVTASRRALTGAFLLNCLAWVLGVAALYLAARAVGAPVPVGVVMVAIPLAAIAGIVPTPAGIGPTEFAIAGTLVVMAGTVGEAAAAAALLFRVYTLGLEVGLGALSGLVLAAVGGRPA